MTALTVIDVAAAIKRVGLTQQQVADRYGVTARTVQNWCAGKTRPPVAVVHDLEAEAFAAADAALEAAEPMAAPERAALMRGVEQEQVRQIAHLRAALEQAERDLRETRGRLKRLGVAPPGSARDR